MLPREVIDGHIQMAKESVRAADAPIGVVTAVDRLAHLIEVLSDEVTTLLLHKNLVEDLLIEKKLR